MFLLGILPELYVRFIVVIHQDDDESSSPFSYLLFIHQKYSILSNHSRFINAILSKIMRNEMNLGRVVQICNDEQDES